MTILPDRRSIRFRITALATVLVVAVLAAASVGLLLLQRQQLISNLDSSLEQRADAYEASLREGGVGELGTLVNSNDEDRAVQIVDESGRVVAATPNLVGAPALAVSESASRQEIRDMQILHIEDDNFRVLTRRIDSESGRATVHVAQNTDDLSETIGALTVALGVSVPFVVAVLAALVWWLTGRTLRPVELIRAEAADISGTDQHRRLPVPDQGDEVSRLAVTMNEMLDRMDHARRRQRQFVADASHELRTPLTRIRTELEVDVHRPEQADPASTNAALLEETVALQQLLDDLLFLARSDEGQNVGRLRPTDLDDIVLREVRDARTASGVEIDVANVSAAHLDADADQLTRAMRNLLDNATRHARSMVTVELREDATGIDVVVSDDGDGVPPEAEHRIFERFGRVDDARTRNDGGAGLGLAIVSDIVKRHGGSIRYENGDPGARFVARLPRRAQVAAEHDG